MKVSIFLKRGESPGTLGMHRAAEDRLGTQQETNLSEGQGLGIRSTAVRNTAGILPEKNSPPCLFWGDSPSFSLP